MVKSIAKNDKRFMRLISLFLLTKLFELWLLDFGAVAKVSV